MIRSHSRRGDSAAQKWLHWGMALLVAILAAVGLTMTRLGEGTVTGTLYELHKSIDLIVLALVTARMAVRLARGVPPPEPGVPDRGGISQIRFYDGGSASGRLDGAVPSVRAPSGGNGWRRPSPLLRAASQWPRRFAGH